MSDLEKVAAWAATTLNDAKRDLDKNCGCIPGHWESDPEWTADSVLKAAGVRVPAPCECNCHYGGSCGSPYPCCPNANIF